MAVSISSQEWSIGWEEPHGPGFQVDGGFAVLVPCYKPGCKQLLQGPNNQLLTAMNNLSNGFSSGNNLFLLKFTELQVVEIVL
ncbi:hypothetical protein V6N11_065409 [Hibiscus sabdariffa]|uniref:Uncharacterized protein n=2 Tax=Hibiscus sabdariffa TaxID=183260 RepID=A0ABR2AAA7_9ROSI